MQSRSRITLAGAAALAVLVGASAASGTADTSNGHPQGGRDAHAKHWPGHGHHQHGKPGKWNGSRGSVEKVSLYAVDGTKVGRAKLRQTRDGVLVTVSARALTPGFHGLHVHGVGLCEGDAPDGPFTTAGGHYTGGQPNHGDHAGDLPSLLVGDEGQAWTSFVTDRFTLDELRDADGSALMVHSGKDNYANIPQRYTAGGVAGPDATTLGTGDAGTRVACGVID